MQKKNFRIITANKKPFISKKFNIYRVFDLKKLFINNELNKFFEAISRFLVFFFLEFHQ